MARQFRNQFAVQFVDHRLQHGHNPIGAADPDLANTPAHLSHVMIALGLVTGAQVGVRDLDRRAGVVEGIKPARDQPGLGNGALPGPDHLGRVVFLGGGVDLVENVQELGRVGAPHGLRDQVLKGVLHGPGLRMAGIEKDQHQVGQVDDVVGDTQGGSALVIGIEARAVDHDDALGVRAGHRLELKIGVDALTLAGGDLLDLVADAKKREARVGVQGRARQHAIVGRLAKANDRELVVDGLVAGGLKINPKMRVDERGLAGRESPQHADHGPPGNTRGQRIAPVEQAGPVQHAIDALEQGHEIDKVGVFGLQVGLQRLQTVTQRGAFGHLAVSRS